MADIVITIPDEVVKNETYTQYLGCMSSKLDEVLHNAVKLPKGHGELKDMGKLKYIFYLDRDEPVYTGKDIKKAIDSMKTLVEADKSEIDARQQMLINHLNNKTPDIRDEVELER